MNSISSFHFSLTVDKCRNGVVNFRRHCTYIKIDLQKHLERATAERLVHLLLYRSRDPTFCKMHSFPLLLQ